MTEFGGVGRLLYGKNAFRYHVVPITFLIGFTGGTQVLMALAQGHTISLDRILENLRGDAVSWLITLLFYFWAWLFIRISSKIHLGPETSFGYRPPYADNGWTYFLATMALFIVLQALSPGTSRLLYDKFPKIMGVSNSFALLFCLWLLVKAKFWRDNEGDLAEPAPLPYEYYRGMELHPRFLGVDVKQWTNCRVGMMWWPLLLTAFYVVYVEDHGYSAACFMHYILQMVYIAKFYWWEDGYFHTLDMMTDRAGYYMCWGCLVFLPAYFCFPLSYVITHPPNLYDCTAYAIGGLGLVLTLIEYWIDQQKHGFRQAWPKPYKIWGKPAEFILAEYKDSHGERKKSPLLISGFWGAARHCNYSLEMIISFTVSATLGFNNGIITFGYFLLIAPLVVHRVLRDDEKCSAKYGKDWIKYKNQVKHIFIPGDNGFSFYLATFGAYLVAHLIWPALSSSLYDNFPQLLGCFNIVALSLCLYLWIKGKWFAEFSNDRQEERPMLYEFYRGLELHPRIFGVDVKQLTNCRIGLMCWQIFIVSFYIVCLQRNGFNAPATVDVFLQTIYLAKFFWWEAGYFYTLDMMLDRAGYYLCWGCLVWVTGFYTYSSYYHVAHPNNLPVAASGFLLVFGLLAIFLNYRVDYEKQKFRNSSQFKCNLWGRPATFVAAEYTDSAGKKCKSALLTSGFWGKGRHINYTFELLAAWSWCAPGALGNSLLPFSYFFFLLGLLLHRTIRDEDKCAKKYGKYWVQYCKKVPYRLLPYIW